MKLILILVALLALSGMLYLFAKKYTHKEKTTSFPYKQKQYFFTRSEQELLRIIEEKIDHRRYAVFPKVRMGDFVEVDLPKGQRKPFWNRIRSRHVDFLLWDKQTSSIALAIELDGNSHNTHQAHTADGFKDEVYKTIGLPLVRIQVGSDFESEVLKALETRIN